MMRESLTALLLVGAVLAPAHADGLSGTLAGRSVACGWGTAFYFAPDGRAVTTLAFAEGAFPIEERTLALDPSSVRADAPDRLELVVAGGDKPVRYRFLREAKAAGGPARAPITLRMDDDEAGDECVIKAGRSDYAETRFNMIRESLCGNDPLDACIAALRTTCGAAPDAACVARVEPRLRAINARAKRG